MSTVDYPSHSDDSTVVMPHSLRTMQTCVIRSLPCTEGKTGPVLTDFTVKIHTPDQLKIARDNIQELLHDHIQALLRLHKTLSVQNIRDFLESLPEVEEAIPSSHGGPERIFRSQ